MQDRQQPVKRGRCQIQLTLKRLRLNKKVSLITGFLLLGNTCLNVELN